ncbi:MAG: radical SAM protein [Elusimicrobiota bacterium]
MRITFSWDIGCFCNFKCEYCFFTQSGWENMEKLQGKPRSPEEIDTAWKYIFGKYGEFMLYITGGEPFLYPGFVEIVKSLSKYSFLHITTNLSYPVNDLLKAVSPERVSFNCTYHPRYMEIDRFIRRIIDVRKEGFICDVCYLAHPGQLREMLSYKKYFRASGIDMALTVFWGNHRGIEYPKGYTEGQKLYYRYTAEWAPEQSDRNLVVTGREKIEEQINDLDPGLSLDKMCKAGYNYATVKVNGDILRCGQLSGPLLGNIFRHDLEMLERETKCRVDYCRSREIEYTEGE